MICKEFVVIYLNFIFCNSCVSIRYSRVQFCISINNKTHYLFSDRTRYFLHGLWSIDIHSDFAHARLNKRIVQNSSSSNNAGDNLKSFRDFLWQRQIPEARNALPTWLLCQEFQAFIHSPALFSVHANHNFLDHIRLIDVSSDTKHKRVSPVYWNSTCPQPECS